ncbi:MAG: MoaD/ThiS family protein [Verrucomicrobia bacterium]|nr:MoaD/ThiS family protein [Verrucomicrobiota bacterium]
MMVQVSFYSYFRELAGCPQVTESVAPQCTLGELLEVIYRRFPKLGAMRKSTLVAVGVEYQDRNYLLQEGDEVSLFPPVQGG